MNKEGHLGIVKNAQQPIVKKIDKIDLNQNILKQSLKFSSDNNQNNLFESEKINLFNNSKTPIANASR